MVNFFVCPKPEFAKISLDEISGYVIFLMYILDAISGVKRSDERKATASTYGRQKGFLDDV